MMKGSEMTDRGKSEAGGWNREQLALIDVRWPPIHGWRKAIIGVEFPDAIAEQFIALRKAKRNAT